MFHHDANYSAGSDKVTIVYLLRHRKSPPVTSLGLNRERCVKLCGAKPSTWPPPQDNHEQRPCHSFSIRLYQAIISHEHSLGLTVQKKLSYTTKSTALRVYISPEVFVRWSMFTPYFEVCDSEGISTVRIQGSCCNTRCLSEQELQVRNPPAVHLHCTRFTYPSLYSFLIYWGHQVVSTIGESVGRIWKRWPGYNEECNMDHEYFGLDGKINIHIHIMWSTSFSFFLLFLTFKNYFITHYVINMTNNDLEIEQNLKYFLIINHHVSVFCTVQEFGVCKNFNAFERSLLCPHRLSLFN